MIVPAKAPWIVISIPPITTTKQPLLSAFVQDIEDDLVDADTVNRTFDSQTGLLGKGEDAIDISLALELESACCKQVREQVLLILERLAL